MTLQPTTLPEYVPDCEYCLDMPENGYCERCGIGEPDPHEYISRWEPCDVCCGDAVDADGYPCSQCRGTGEVDGS